MRTVAIVAIFVVIIVAAIAVLVGVGMTTEVDTTRETLEPIVTEYSEQIRGQEQSQGTENTLQSFDCIGSARCFTGIVTGIIDGDTIKVAGQSVRFALSSAPELSQAGGKSAKEFVEIVCPVGSTALVDEDDGQTQGSYGRILAVIYCNSVNLNEAVLDEGLATIDSSFCSYSEFSASAWAKKHGCNTKSPNVVAPQTKQSNCDPAYPTVCIPSPPPDLDCGEIPYKNFKVVGSDPHRFDGDKDGIGCE